MSPMDWVGLWAMLQVIGPLIGLAIGALIALVVLVDVFVLTPIRERRKRGRR